MTGLLRSPFPITVLSSVGLLLISLLACRGPQRPETHRLELSTEVQEIQPGAIHLYDLPLEEGASIRLVADLRIGDVALRLENPTGEILDRSDAGPEISEQVSGVTTEDTVYRLVVTGRGAEGSPPSKYRLSIDDQRPSHPLNPRRVEADRWFRDGFHKASSGRSAEELRAALEDYGRARDLWQVVGDRCEQAITWNRMGRLHGSLGEFEAARAAYDASLHQWHACRDTAGEPTALELATLRNRANLERDHGRLEEAEAWYQRLLKPLRTRLERGWSASDARRLAQHLRAWAVLQRRGGRLEEAQATLQESLALALAAGSPWPEVARTLTELGTTHRAAGRTGQARGAYRRARGLAAGDSVDMKELRAAIDNNVGVVDLLEGRFEEAAAGFEKTLQFNRERRDENNIGRILRNLAAAESRAGRPLKARSYLEETLKLYRRRGDQEGELATAVRLSWLEIDSGDRAKIAAAADRLADLVPTAEGELPRAAASAVRGALGFALLRGGRFLEALEHLERAVVLGQQGDRVGAAQSRVLLGEALFEAGRSAAATALLAYEGAEEEYASLPAADSKRLHLLARLAQRRGQPEASRRFYERALARVEGLRDLLPATKLRATFFAGKRRVYEDYVDFLLRSEHTASTLRTAFAVSERAHARSLFELLQERALDVQLRLPVEDRGRLTDLKRRRRVLQAQLWGEDVEQASGGVDTLLHRLQGLEERLNDLEAELRTRHPTLRALDAPAPPKLEDLQDLLGPETALLEYLIGEEQGWLFVVREASIDSFPITVGELAPLVATFSQHLTGVPTADPTAFAATARSLEARLLAPARAVLEGVQRWILVPDGPLHHLPFEALVDSRAVPATSWSELHYLVRDQVITYAPSAAIFQNLGSVSLPTASENRRFITFGPPRELPQGLPPLPSANGEVRELAARHEVDDFEVLLYLDDLATEERFKEQGLVRPGDRLHLASHALFQGPEPGTRPRLVLAKSDEDDGALELHELWNLDLPADLVVLAACGTHGGESIHGEGLMGLGRGFLGAGARRVLASLVPVHDRATRDLMTAFYDALATASTAEALRTAKLALIENGDSPPSYWAPFILVGDPR